MSATAGCNDAAPSRPSSIPTVVVESHQHVLEHIHAVLRHRARLHSRVVRRRRQQASNNPSLPPPISMIHFDSHPDLACLSPCVLARACFQPRREWPVQLAVGNSNGEEDDTSTPDETSEDMTRTLYENLDLDRSGIAQWIFPLVFSGDLNYCHWVRSAWADQIEDGQYRYNVGAWIHRKDANELPNVAKFIDLPKEAIMKVDFDHKYYYEDNSTVPSNELILPKEMKLKVSELPSANNEDVDSDLEEQEWILDVCLDYFLCRNPFVDELEEIDTEFAAAFVAIVEQAKFSPLQYQQEYERFQKSVAKFLESLLVGPVSSSDPGIIFQDGCGVEESLVQRLLEAAHKCTDQDRSKIIHLAIDALPSVTLPHDEYVDDDEALRSATVQIEAMEAYLRGIRTSSSRYRPEPMMITVAREVLTMALHRRRWLISFSDGFLQWFIVCIAAGSCNGSSCVLQL